MRIRFVALLVSIAACLGFAGTLCAQLPELTKEQLQMTADPKAPGAAASILYLEERTDDNLHYHSIVERIKILTEKGKDAATIHVPYDRSWTKVQDIQGRTIHSDGTVYPLTTKPSDLTDVNSKYFQFNEMVFTLPNVEVGSVIEYRLQIRYDDQWISSPEWIIQQRYFVHKAHYFFQPSHYREGIMWSPHVKEGTKVVRDSQGRFTYDVDDVPALPDEDWMPPLNSLKMRIAFYYADYPDGQQFWRERGKEWAKDTEKFASADKAIKGAVAELVSATDTEEQKAKKLYDAVMKLENTDFTRRKSQEERKKEKIKEVKKAEDVWMQKSGGSDDLALLYVAMARAAGLQVVPMQVVNRDRAIFDPDYLQVLQLDDYIAVATINGKEVYLDPGQKMCPFGLLHWKHTYASGLRVSGKGAEIAATPGNLYTQNTMQRVADLTVSPDGSAAGTLRVVMSGQQALHWRQTAIRNDEDEVKKRFNETMRDSVPEGMEAEFDHFLALDDYNANLVAVLKVNGQLGSATGKRFFLPGMFFESRAKHPFVATESRKIPVDVHYPERVVDDVTYHLPEGFAVESAPQAATIPFGSSAQLRVASKNDKDKVEIARSLAYNFTLVEQKDYTQLRDFYQKVATADQQQLVLARAAQAAK
ncbi:DUF3857 domain-containing protein [Occallatibacter riparius]|uniref:DUF3857 domain-containing protein n=1 Tax=Occallatibacter riparius TaxID=1002689 RepID=A0A9J7BPM1_9BACT|nr:DUF3857 domain-containing protein [Occallatibacter riparius]UWZ84715.1 DUF3857 domain-containing protein [Occallatibacter riparius]